MKIAVSLVVLFIASVGFADQTYIIEEKVVPTEGGLLNAEISNRSIDGRCVDYSSIIKNEEICKSVALSKKAKGHLIKREGLCLNEQSPQDPTFIFDEQSQKYCRLIIKCMICF